MPFQESPQFLQKVHYLAISECELEIEKFDWPWNNILIFNMGNTPALSHWRQAILPYATVAVRLRPLLFYLVSLSPKPTSDISAVARRFFCARCSFTSESKLPPVSSTEGHAGTPFFSYQSIILVWHELPIFLELTKDSACNLLGFLFQWGLDIFYGKADNWMGKESSTLEQHHDKSKRWFRVVNFTYFVNYILKE